MKLISIVCTLLFFVSCSSNPNKLSKKGKAVEVVKSKPYGCEVLGKVVGENDFGSPDVATNMARNQAADLDATHLLLKDEVVNGNHTAIHALALECK